MIVVLCGGVGAARLLRALETVVPAEEVTALVNTGDDLILHGLTICPDLDTITYTLAQENDDVRGWGLREESWRVMSRLGELGGASWFSLGDLDLATHLYRSQRIAEGATKSDVTAELARHFAIRQRLLPMTNDVVSTEFDTELGRLSFQEYFVRHHHDVTVTAVRYEGGAAATPAPGVLEALSEATRIIIAPSNPLLSIQPLLEMPAVAELVRGRRDDVVSISPLVGGNALKGPADRLLRELHGTSDNATIARYYAPYSATLVVDVSDASDVGAVENAGMTCRVTTTIMNSPEHERALCAEVLR